MATPAAPAATDPRAHASPATDGVYAFLECLRTEAADGESRHPHASPPGGAAGLRPDGEEGAARPRMGGLARLGARLAGCLALAELIETGFSAGPARPPRRNP